MGIFHQENDHWIVCAYGYTGHHPGRDHQSLSALAESCTPPYWYTAVEAAQWQTPVVAMHYPRTVRRRYDRHPAMPQGLLVTGDALCSFNPIYGQGMTVAALEAAALRRCLASVPDHELASRFYATTRTDLDTVWRLGLGGDLRFASVAGPRPMYLRPLNRYVEAVQAAAAHDPRVTRTLWRVAGLLDPPQHLFHPRVIAAAALHQWRQHHRPGDGAPAGAGQAPAISTHSTTTGAPGKILQKITAGLTRRGH